MKAWLKRHRWNVINVLGVVLIIWVGPYLNWRSTSVVVLSSRLIFAPAWFPEELDFFFRPLTVIDGWISGESAQISRFTDGYDF